MLTLRRLVLLIGAATVISASECGDEDREVPYPVLDSPSGVTVGVGETVRASCSLSTDFHNSLNPVSSWESINSAIATVAGVTPADECSAAITGVAIGETTVNFYVITAFLSFDPRLRVLPVTVIAAPAPGCVNPTTILDNFDTPLAWVATVISTTGATASAEPRTTGGDPIGFRFMQHNLPGNSDLAVIHLLGVAGKTYNPAAQGAIHHINYSEDRKELNPPFVGAAIGSSFVIQQGGTTYVKAIGANGAFINTDWATATLSDLTAADFPGIDFSAAGGEMTFGFVRSNTNNGGTAATTQHGIDDFTVTICH